MEIYYQCRLNMRKSRFERKRNVRVFIKGRIYKALDSDNTCTLFECETGDLIIIEQNQMNKYFIRVNIMPEFPRKN